MRTKLSASRFGKAVPAALVLISGLTLLVLTPAMAWGGEPDLADVAQVTSSIRSSNFKATTDLVFLSEGYSKDEHERFLADARAMTDRLERSPAGEPMRSARVFNYHYVFVPSTVRASAGRKAAATPFRARVEDERLVTETARVDEGVKLAADVDVAITLVRFAPRSAEGVRATARIPRFRGETFEEGRVAIPATDTDDFLHELGHALWALGDEYAEVDEALTPMSRSAIAERANLTTDGKGARWYWARVGKVYEGAGRLKKGVFRPERDCIMRDLAAPGFCRVCRAVLSGAYDVDPVDPIAVEVAQGPLTGSMLVAGVPVEVKWHAGGPSPISYALVVVRISRKTDEVVSRVLEGHELAFTLDALEPGRYELRLQSRNVAPRRGRWVVLGFTVARAHADTRD